MKINICSCGVLPSVGLLTQQNGKPDNRADFIIICTRNYRTK